MRPLSSLGAGIVGAGALVACCALGPAAILAGVGVALAGLGLGAWIAAAVGVTIAIFGVARTRTRAGRGTACAQGLDAAAESQLDPVVSRADPHERTGQQ